MWQARYGLRLIASTVRMLTRITVACVLIAVVMTGTALACQKDHHVVGTVVVNPKSASASMVTATVSPRPMKDVGKVDHGGQRRCSPDCNCQTIGCGCSFASVASFNLVSTGLFLPATSTRLSPVDQSEAASARPPPDFRPPRPFI
jgi:hypothetical protein